MKLPAINIKRVLITALTLCVVLSVVSIAIAQEIQRTVTEAYPTLSHTLNPGDHAEGITRLINQSNVPLTFNVTVQDFIVTDTVGTPNILPAGSLNKKYSASAWIGVTPDTFTLQPGEKQTINYYVQVPSNARPGGHYAAIVYTPLVKNTVEGSGGTVQGKLGSLFYITINGPITQNSTITKFFANPFQEYGPIKILTQIKNMGDLHISPKATISVTGFLFNQSQNIELHNIFPETARDYQNIFGKTFMLGRYKAVLLGSYGLTNNLPLTATVYFWIFPWRLSLVIILILIAGILGWMYLKKRKTISKKQAEEPKGDSEGQQTKKS